MARSELRTNDPRRRQHRGAHGSSRLPGKMAADIAGRPALARVIERLRQARRLDAIVLANTAAAQDDEFAAIADAEGVPTFRGSEDDVMGRVVEAHRMMGTELIVEMCGDCPLLDPEFVDAGIEAFFANDCDVVTSSVKKSYPKGTEVHVSWAAALAEAASRTAEPTHREHVSLYFYDHPEAYRIHHLAPPPELTAPGVRLVLDYAEDLELIRRLYDRLLASPAGPGFRTADVLAVLRGTPEQQQINAAREPA